jgi:predicted CoA-binding protein
LKEELIKRFLQKKNIFAVVGASKNPKKFGNQVYNDLKKAGYNIYPINPNASEIFGDKCYPSLESLPLIPDVVDIVVPPKITEKIVEKCKELGINKVWMQPGSESDKAIEYCKKNKIDLIYNVCIMVERAKMWS